MVTVTVDPGGAVPRMTGTDSLTFALLVGVAIVKLLVPVDVTTVGVGTIVVVRVGVGVNALLVGVGDKVPLRVEVGVAFVLLCVGVGVGVAEAAPEERIVTVEGDDPMRRFFVPSPGPVKKLVDPIRREIGLVVTASVLNRMVAIFP